MRYFRLGGDAVARVDNRDGYLYFSDGSTPLPLEDYNPDLRNEISEAQAVDILGGRPWERTPPPENKYVKVLKWLADFGWSISLLDDGFYRVLGCESKEIPSLSWRKFRSVEKAADALLIWVEHNEQLTEKLNKLEG